MQRNIEKNKKYNNKDLIRLNIDAKFILIQVYKYHSKYLCNI